METMQELKRRSQKKVLPISLLLIAGGIAIFIIFGCWQLPKTFAPKNLTDVPLDQLEGTFVQADIDWLYGDYMYTEETRNNVPTGTITGIEYLIDCGDSYMGLKVPRSLVKDTRAMMKENQKGNGGMIFHVQGMVSAMEGTQLRYYKEAIDYDSMSGFMQDKYLMLYIDVDQINGHSISMLWFLAALSLVLVIWGAVCILRAASGSYQKPLRRRLAAMGDLSQMEERFDQFYQSRDAVSGLRMDDEFFLIETGAKQELMRPWEIAWAYQCTTRHYRGVIPTGTSYTLRLRLMNGKQRDIAMSQNEVQNAMQAMGQTLPAIVLGYSKELEMSYKQNRDAFRQRWEAAKPGCTSRS